MSEEAYLNLARDILDHGHFKDDRTHTGTYSVFGRQLRFNLESGFPLLTTKKVPFGLIKSELLWFIKGDTNIRYLLQHHNHIWDEWAFLKYIQSDTYQGPDMTDFGHRRLLDDGFKQQYEIQMQKFTAKILTDNQFAEKFGDLGSIYGRQWRAWKTSRGETIDQLSQVITAIKEHPDSRRLIVSAWNPEDIPSMALPPCHTLFQFYVVDGKLSLQLYQRSGDLFLGVPFNIASYALLTHLVARETGLQVGEFVHTFGDVHIYQNHVQQIKQQLERTPRPQPQLIISPRVHSMFDLTPDDIQVDHYEPYPGIKAPVAV